jgi:hypothetical protein
MSDLISKAAQAQMGLVTALLRNKTKTKQNIYLYILTLKDINMQIEG